MAILNDIDHFVVLMLENRPFDNLLGHVVEPKITIFSEKCNASSEISSIFFWRCGYDFILAKHFGC